MPEKIYKIMKRKRRNYLYFIIFLQRKKEHIQNSCEFSFAFSVKMFVRKFSHGVS
jgi:hypothetical protein